jgi:hypothetical protein
LKRTSVNRVWNQDIELRIEATVILREDFCDPFCAFRLAKKTVILLENLSIKESLRQQLHRTCSKSFRKCNRARKHLRKEIADRGKLEQDIYVQIKYCERVLRKLQVGSWEMACERIEGQAMDREQALALMETAYGLVTKIRHVLDQSMGRFLRELGQSNGILLMQAHFPVANNEDSLKSSCRATC